MLDKIQVTRSSMPDYEEYCEEIKDLWDSRWLTNFGSKYRQLEQQLKDMQGVPYTVMFANGHLALEIALAALECSGGEVITTPFTFASTTFAILRSGLTPVFCDINPETYCIDADRIETLITEKTVAILPVHVYGSVCDYKKIQSIADKHGLKVIYDAAHAFGEEVDGTPVGALGDMSMFSFHATKVFNSIEGGCLTLSDAELEKKCMAMCQFGITGKDKIDYIGTNAKMNEFSAAMGLCNLRRLDEYIEGRRAADRRYRERLGGVEGITLREIQSNVKSNYAYFPIVIDPERFGEDRDSLMDRLARNEIYSRKYFYPLTSEFDAVKKLVDPGDTPVAKQIADRVLTIPLYSELSAEDVDRICDIILEVKR